MWDSNFIIFYHKKNQEMWLMLTDGKHSFWNKEDFSSKVGKEKK